MAQILDGKACAKAVRARIRSDVRALAPALGRPPRLAFIQVGENPASTAYVNMKSQAAEKAGMLATIDRLPESTPQDALLALLAHYNAEPSVDGILVQLPLPEHMDPLLVAASIDPDKDLDCFNPGNVGRLTIGLPGPRPATPQGILMLLDHYGVDVRGMEAVVIGRSNLVGKPMGIMLLALHATVTWCHSRTADLAAHTRRAQLIVSAAGSPELLRGDMLMPGVVVVDVGTSYAPDLKGDVHFASAEPVAGWISPVPGGVGPMTIASVLQNALMLYKRRNGLE